MQLSRKSSSKNVKYCVLCGKPIEKYSDDPEKRKTEEKWCIHWQCRVDALDFLDRESLKYY